MSEKVIIDGLPMLLGDTSKELQKVSFLCLNVGDKISQIGRKTKRGGFSSSCRIFKLQLPVIYSGIFIDNDETYIAFELHSSCIPELNMNATILFIPIIIDQNEPELILQNYNTNSILIHKAVFTLAN